MNAIQEIEKALVLGACFQALDLNDGGKFLFVWWTGDQNNPNECSCMGFDTMQECARDAISEIEHVRARAS